MSSDFAASAGRAVHSQVIPRGVKVAEVGSGMQILAVVVLYKQVLEDAQTIRGLTECMERHPELRPLIGLLIWDNSPAPLVRRELPFPFEYKHCPQNVGVSGAYNGALEIAERFSCPWMLLLDQDTTIPDDYLNRLLFYSHQLESNLEIAAIAPFLLSGNKTITPGIIRFYGITLMSRPFSGVYSKEVYAGNSGTLMRVAALREIGGYDERFWLDYSDIVAFHHLYRQGKRLYVAGDLQLQHVIASFDYDGRMSPERYRNFMIAEEAYCDLYRPGWQNAIQTLRLFARSLKQYLRFKNKKFSRISWTFFWRRVLFTKTRRLIHWQQQSIERDLPVIADGRVIG
jgi:GT2 family glycosyltransferase